MTEQPTVPLDLARRVADYYDYECDAATGPAASMQLALTEHLPALAALVRATAPILGGTLPELTEDDYEALDLAVYRGLRLRQRTMGESLRAAADALHARLAAQMTPHVCPPPLERRNISRDQVREGMTVTATVGDLTRTGVAHRQDEDGDWYTEKGYRLTNLGAWPLTTTDWSDDEDFAVGGVITATPDRPIYLDMESGEFSTEP